MSIGEQVKQLRLRQKLEQEDFAKSIDITRSWLNKIENGRAPVSDKVLSAISSVYNVNLSEQKSSSLEATKTNEITARGKTITVDQDKLIQRMCEWIAVTVAHSQVLKAELIALKSRVTGESAASISVELDALIAKVDSNLWEEFARKWS